MIDVTYETEHQMGNYPKWIIYTVLSVFPVLGIIFIIFSIVVFYYAVVIDAYPVIFSFLLFTIICAIGTVLIVVGWKFINTGMAKYRFKKEGVYVKFPLKPEQLFRWDNFQQVCVCYSAYTTRGKQKANTVICCVMHGERKNAYGRWKTENPFRYRTVFCINYSLSLHNGIKEMCPYEVIDLRETYAYRLDIYDH